jgi:heat shock protein 1/8
MTKVAIGIDLGTCYSCVGILKGSRVEIITNDQGNRTTPSCVSFTETERLIGDAAKNQSAMNAKNTIFEAKRLIGRNFNDTSVQDDMKLWPFDIVDVNGKPKVQVSYKNETKKFSPEEISAMILGKMKETAESFLGEKVTDAVITVPAYFNDAQRNSTKDAGIIAGLNVLRIINEPTAAAIAYGLNTENKEDIHVLVFDYGGGTFDVSILNIDEGVFEVKATAGNCHLGGADLDQCMAEHFCNEFKRKHKKDIRSNPRSVRRLLTACERAKRTLSISTSATVEIDSLFDGIDFHGTISRARFEELCIHLFRQTMEPVEKVLRDAKISKSQINEVVLVGGSTRIPKIRTMLSDLFNGKTLCEKINPDEAVAYGAAVQAAILSGNDKELNQDVVLLDVTPLSLGIETEGRMMTNIIDRNQAIPCTKQKVFSTHVDNQPAVTIRVFEGERAMTSDNHLLGEFTMTGIPPMKRGLPQIEVSYSLDTNGILKVTAVEKSSNISQNIEIKNESGRLTKSDVERMINEAEKFKEEDDKIKKDIEARNSLEGYMYSIKNTFEESKDIVEKLGEETVEGINSKLKEVREWLDNHEHEDAHVYEDKQKEIEDIFNEVMKDVQGSMPPPSQPPSEMKVEDVD